MSIRRRGRQRPCTGPTINGRRTGTAEPATQPGNPNAFLPALRQSAHPRVVNVSSGTGSLTWATDPQSRHWPGRYAAYRSSKTALNALTVFYAHTLADDGIKVNALAPGLRRTDLNATAAASGGDPAEAAAGAVRLALLPDHGPTGEFFSWEGTPVPW
jgi:NAD(P)-dependent dehydrogenase (short-subunit alcohol dehydrogenase family)